jgi:hypothetical protein
VQTANTSGWTTKMSSGDESSQLYGKKTDKLVARPQKLNRSFEKVYKFVNKKTYLTKTDQ